MEQQYHAPDTFSPDQWQTCQSILWQDLEYTNLQGNQLQAKVDADYERVAKQRPYQMLTETEKADIDAYWANQRALSESRDREGALMDLLEKIEEGIATPADVIPFLPEQEEQQTESGHRRSAREPRIVESWMGVMDVIVVPATDPTRISSGRNRKMLKTVGGQVISTYEAEGQFFDVTADTHGGKVRNPGKNGKFYKSSASGKRIRKY